MKIILPFAMLALAACQSPQIEPVPSDMPAAPARPDGVATGAPETLVGQYRVAGIDGSEVGGGIGIALGITDKVIAFEPRCAGFIWTYSYADGDVTTDRPQKPRADGPSLVAGPAAPVCRIAIHPEQARLARALDAVNLARRTPSNGIELTGGDHSVTLYSQ